MSPELLPDSDAIVPTFSATLEADIDRTLAERLGHAATADERSDYRQVLWAFATAIRDILEAPPPSPPPCPAPPSTFERAASRMTDSA